MTIHAIVLKLAHIMKVKNAMMTTKQFISLAVLFVLNASTAQASFLSDMKAYYQKGRTRNAQQFNFMEGIKSTELSPNSVPDVKCLYTSESLEVPGSPVRISQFEIGTTSYGTLDKEPSVSAYLKLRDGHTLRNLEIVTLSVEIQELGWVTDRLSQPKGIVETTFRRNVNLGGVNYHLVFKRTINDIKKPVISAEMILYSVGDNSVPVLHARCNSEIKKK